MPTGQKLEAILDEAGQREKENDWTAAAKLYENCLSLVPKTGNSLKAGELLEKIGSCHRRAATQADNRGSFSECMTSAMEAYSKAGKLYEISENEQAEAFRCLATAYYTKHWLAPTSIEKRNS